MRRTALLGALALACSFDASTVQDHGAPAGSSSGSTGAAASTEGPGTTLATSSSEVSTGDPAVTGMVTATPTTGGASSTAGSTSSTGSTTDDPGSSTGDPIPPLSDAGLVARYYLDEASMGMGPKLALDAAAAPVDLPLDYAEGQMSYFEDFGVRRGLAFATPGADDGARTLVSGTKFADLAGTTEMTIEVMVRVDDAMSNGSRIVHLGHNDSSTFALGATGSGELEARWNGSIVRRWDYADFSQGAHVLHLIVDTTAANEAVQFRLLVDGSELLPDLAAQVPQDDAAQVHADAIFAVGNRQQDRSIEGIIYYAAVYDVAIADAVVAHHVYRLLEVSDDAPG